MELYVCGADNIFINTKCATIISKIQDKLGAPAVENSSIWRLAEEEYSLLPASTMLVLEMNALREIWRNCPKSVPPPVGSAYSSCTKADDVDSIRLIHKVETLLAGYLNICYGVTERIEATTQKLYKEDRRMWTDLIEDTGTIYVSNVRLERLIETFYKKHTPGETPQERILNLVRSWRNARTHATHFQAFATGPDIEFTFADRNPYQGAPTISFDEFDLRASSQFFGMFIGWWVGATEQQLDAL